MRPPRVVMCGSRSWRMGAVIDDSIACLPEGTLVISGGAPGADRMVVLAAERQGFHCAVIRALWRVRGRRAGHERNGVMLALLERETDWVEAFWDGTSPGTSGCIAKARALGLKVVVYDTAGGTEVYPSGTPEPVQGSLL